MTTRGEAQSHEAETLVLCHKRSTKVSRRVPIPAHFDAHLRHPEGVCQRADELAAQGKTVILVRHDDEVCTLFGVADTPRGSRRALAELKASGGIHTVMLTGDNQRVADAIGHQVGVDEVRAGVLPEEKVFAVADLQEKYRD